MKKLDLMSNLLKSGVRLQYLRATWQVCKDIPMNRGQNLVYVRQLKGHRFIVSRKTRVLDKSESEGTMQWSKSLC